MRSFADHSAPRATPSTEKRKPTFPWAAPPPMLDRLMEVLLELFESDELSEELFDLEIEELFESE